MITIEQCRAARGLLDWTQQDLADRSGLSKTAINNFEKGYSDIKTDSLRAIRNAFEAHDVQFIEKIGVCKKCDDIVVIKGNSLLVHIESGEAPKELAKNTKKEMGRA